ncbi:MAG: isopeptide-forming domain-containing fimbrial protein [Ruminococcus sp.]|uniref:SpaA isopeptide-forming pilin-related protein n=1 Tax=Ruminococcus sp. TaxID=41978 RepID=UPI0025D5ED42|nr:SpaA isopeptide-forming pilin-related protein [Ruminococcus sp.]MCR5540594.1 isopeptide-forming domain-containing fimbrial protein [Ruminococcus sp.]
MKKMYKRTTAIAATALMLAQLVPYSVFAEPGQAVNNNKNSLIICPYIVSETTYQNLNSSNAAPTGTDADEDQAIHNGTKYTGTTPMTFSVVKVNENGSPVSGTEAYSETATQEIALANIPDGYYKITPNNTTTEKADGTNFKGAESFYIELPTSASGNINRNVYIYPKLTDNKDTTGNTYDPEQKVDPSDPDHTPNKHSLKLKKTLSSGEWSETTPAVFDIYYKDDLGNWVDAGDFQTDAYGVIQVDGLPLGTYYAVEREAPEGYLLDQTPIEFNLDGSGDISKQVKEFKNDKKLTSNKVIDVDGQGKNYNWTITTDIPSKADKLISYRVTDTYTATLTDVAIVSVYAGSTLLTEGTDYEVINGTNDKTIKIIDFTNLIEKTQLTINVTSKIGSGYSTGNITNEASLKYQYAYTPTDVDNDGIIDDIPSIPEPVIYDPENPNPGVPTPTPIDTDAASDSFTPATIRISNVDDNGVELSDGAYFVSGCSYHYDIENDNDGDFNIVTLSNLAPGHYSIDQRATKDGYYIDRESPKFIYIDKDGNVFLTNSETATEGTLLTSSNNTIVFHNHKTAPGFELPFTGTTATIVFTIAGIGVMGGALFFFIFFKKRDKDEEENENA